MCAVYCLDAHFVTDVSKFVGGCFQALAAMVHLEIPHLNILTKMDLCPNRVSRKYLPFSYHNPAQDGIEDFLNFDKDQLINTLQHSTRSTFTKLNAAVVVMLPFNLS